MSTDTFERVEQSPTANLPTEHKSAWQIWYFRGTSEIWKNITAGITAQLDRECYMPHNSGQSQRGLHGLRKTSISAWERCTKIFASIIIESQSGFRFGRCTEEITIVCPLLQIRLKVCNKTLYVIVIDLYKKVQRRGEKMTVLQWKYGCPKRFVEMTEALYSGVMELEKRRSKASSTFGRLHMYMWMRLTPAVSARNLGVTFDNN